jgi:hypothetical protein
MKKLLTLSGILVLSSTFAAAQQTCTATTSSVIGSYTYIATVFPFASVAVNAPGSTTTTGTTSTQPYSNTQVGNLLSALNGGAAYSSANIIYFDGAGNISTSSSSSTFAGSTVVGTYTVNSDCTISITLMDVFNTTASGAGTVATQGKTSLIGVVVDGGTEIILSEPQSASSTNGNTPLVAGQFTSRATIQLIRTYNYGCTVSNLMGSYALIGNGFVEVPSTVGTTTGTGTGTGTGTTTTTTTSVTVQPVSFLGVVTFDGNGNVIQETAASGSPLGSFQLKGTYTMNTNCSGTMSLSSISSSSTTGTGTTTTTGTTTSTTTTAGTATGSLSSMTVNFVLTPPITYPTTNAYSATPSGYSSRPGIEFTFMSGNESIFGVGIAQ